MLSDGFFCSGQKYECFRVGSKFPLSREMLIIFVQRGLRFCLFLYHPEKIYISKYLGTMIGCTQNPKADRKDRESLSKVGSSGCHLSFHNFFMNRLDFWKGGCCVSGLMSNVLFLIDTCR